MNVCMHMVTSITRVVPMNKKYCSYLHDQHYITNQMTERILTISLSALSNIYNKIYSILTYDKICFQRKFGLYSQVTDCTLP